MAQYGCAASPPSRRGQRSVLLNGDLIGGCELTPWLASVISATKSSSRNFFVVGSAGIRGGVGEQVAAPGGQPDVHRFRG